MTRNMIPQQLTFSFDEDIPGRKAETVSTFSDNLGLAVHRWFRYSAGFSALWVRDLITQQKHRGRYRVFDPFAGSGTVLLEGESCNVEVCGVEAHPFVTRIARAKLHWREDPYALHDYAGAILDGAKRKTIVTNDPAPLVKKCFPAETLVKLETLRDAWQSCADGSPLSELIWLALASILRQCSPVGTAQWQYVLPAKTKANPIDPYVAFAAKVQQIAGDMIQRQAGVRESHATLHQGDARTCAAIPAAWADLVITSPPYANNYDYADATRLEMSFFGEIQGWGDLQEAVRQYLVRSCTQHVAGLSAQTGRLIHDPLLAPIQEEMALVCAQLAEEKEVHGGKKPYDTMIAAYFNDLARVWITLRRVSRPGALVCFVIGDSAPYGVYVPVDRWLGELSLAAGFHSYTFEKTRDRNIKWKNRKHRVPLHEGRLWVQG